MAYPDSVIPLGNRELVAKQYSQPGLIFYYIRQRQRQRQRQPRTVPVLLPVPEESPKRQPVQEINWRNVWNVVVVLGLSVVTVAIILAALLDPEPASKLALAGLSITMIITILDTFGIEHDLQDA